ncbi:hypothetical protein QQF64_034468 [Cirrhinus molitorella]|uniref:Integrase catalytic domain-containing protein n=1 Tax=Cirrhinus molitorella TaxID=172907 RepID=A0ABR3L2E8_9TELE
MSILILQQSQKKLQFEEEPPIMSFKVTAPFELVGMDLIGKLTKTDDGYQYICVLIDYFTKWPQAYPLKTKSASEVTNCILKFFYQFEAPKRILTDQGKEFVNSINTDVCKILGTERSLCAPYHPQTNGLVEKINGTVQRALGKLVKSKPNQWNQYLGAVMFGLRTLLDSLPGTRQCARAPGAFSSKIVWNSDL